MHRRKKPNTVDRGEMNLAIWMDKALDASTTHALLTTTIRTCRMISRNVVEKSGRIVAQLRGVATTRLVSNATSLIACIETMVSSHNAEERTYLTTQHFNQLFRILSLIACCSLSLFGQVSTRTELGAERQGNDVRVGYYQIAKPFEVSMTINLWGEVPQQGLFIVPTSTDIIQLLSFSGGIRETANLEEVLLYRAMKDAKDGKSRQLRAVNVRAIVEGGAPVVQLAPGDMVVVKKLPVNLSWQDYASIITTASTLVVLGITIYNLTK